MEPRFEDYEDQHSFDDAMTRYEDAVEDRVNEEIEKRSGTNLITNRTEKILAEVNSYLEKEIGK